MVINAAVPIKSKILVISYESPSRLLSEYIAQELTFKLQRNTSRDIIDTITIDSLQKDYNLKGDTLKTTDALKIAKTQEADFLVVVASRKIKDLIRMDIQIKNAGTGKNIQVVSYTIGYDDLLTELLAGPALTDPAPVSAPAEGAVRRIRALREVSN
jgi:TolB-like protein